MAEKFALHDSPVWRERANFIIHAPLGESLTGKWEQLWARRIAENEFEMCCIPFFAYNLALGDHVETGPSGELRFVVQRVLTPSGRQTFRVWFGEPSDQPAREEVAAALTNMGCLLEWSSANLLAVDADSDRVAQAVADFLSQKQQAGQLIFERGRK